MRQRQSSVKEYYDKWRESNIFAMIVIGGALFIDGTIVSVVVPIIPVFLNEIEQGNRAIIFNLTTTALTPVEEQIKHKDIMNESFAYGLIIATKSISQLMANMFVGPLADRKIRGYLLGVFYNYGKFGSIFLLLYRVGQAKPFFAGFVIVFISTAGLAYGVSIVVLLVARVFQGIGSSFLTVAGLAMLASRYSDDEERGTAMTYVLGGLTFGLLIGAPFGGLVYSITGKAGPFFIICGFTALVAGLRLFMVDRNVDVEIKREEVPSLITLIHDPYIAVTACCIFIGNISYAFLDLGIPIWMLDTMNASSLELGVVFLPCDFSYLIGIRFYPYMIHRLGRWSMALIANIMVGFLLLIIPSTKNLFQLILPMALLGFANGMSKTSLLPELAHLMDLRHSAKYGNVYAIGDFAQCLANGIAPVVGGILMRSISFQWLSTALALLYFLSSPLLLFIRQPPPAKVNEENQPLMRS